VIVGQETVQVCREETCIKARLQADDAQSRITRLTGCKHNEAAKLGARHMMHQLEKPMDVGVVSAILHIIAPMSIVQALPLAIVE
jgi:hypothetical protein